MRAPILPVSLLLTAAVLAVLFRQALSECCNPPGVGWIPAAGLHSLYARCGDSTQPTPCCGYGKCNFFCCNCDGGCRKRNRRRRQDQDGAGDGGNGDEDLDHFDANDRDRDGKISGDEARRWIIAGGCGNPVLKLANFDQEFGDLDRDKDGLLDRDEIGG